MSEGHRGLLDIMTDPFTPLYVSMYIHLIYLPTYLPAYLPTYLLTYLLTGNGDRCKGQTMRTRLMLFGRMWSFHRPSCLQVSQSVGRSERKFVDRGWREKSVSQPFSQSIDEKGKATGQLAKKGTRGIPLMISLLTFWPTSCSSSSLMFSQGRLFHQLLIPAFSLGLFSPFFLYEYICLCLHITPYILLL